MTEHWVPQTTRPIVLGTNYMVSAGHYAAALAAARVLEAGGNAFDAGVASGLCLNVVQSDMTNLGGVAPICLYVAETGRVETVSGLGWWPKGTDREVLLKNPIPAIHRCVVPAALDAWLTVLKDYGTLSLQDVAAMAIDLAENGFPVHSVMADSFGRQEWLAAMRQWPSTAAIYLDQGSPPAIGEMLVQRDLARTLRMLCEAEGTTAGRRVGIECARQRFYQGDIADTMCSFVQANGGWLDRSDLAEFRVEVEQAVSVNYRGFEVFSCGPWCQGPVVPMTLNILKGYDVASLGHGSVDLFHLVLEALKAAFADRERFFGDPHYVDVPLDALLSNAYGAEWRERIGERASEGMPDPGNPWRHSTYARPVTQQAWVPPTPITGPSYPDTSYVCVVDAEGNAFSATPSDGVVTGPVVPGLGFSVSSRGSQSWLDTGHPATIGAGRRPRLTPSPGMVLKDGRLVMPYGTPGNDVQPQAMVQFLLNVVDFGLNVQSAIEAPRSATYSFPRSSDPHSYEPGLTRVESRAGPDVINGLARRGHRIDPWPEWTGVAGSLSAVLVDESNGVLHGGADPRRVAYAIGR